MKVLSKANCHNQHRSALTQVKPSGSLLWKLLTVDLALCSQQFHAWAHMKKSQIPLVVLALQEAGVLVSRKAHGAHHRPPFEGNYCIVSGIWNKVLDRSGLGVFQKAEHFIYKKTGVAPRNWSETGEDFKNVTYFEFSGSESE